jgi:putative PEP-CTERM system histidine kinase
LFNKNHPISKSEIIGNKALSPVSPEIEILLDEMNTELFVPLIIGDTWVGLLTMGKIQTGEIYDEIEDYGLLKAAAAHAASAIKSARLFEEKMKSHELETFHRLSSFIMHDLKNTTSTLSMVAQNAEKHLNNPEFQKDALKTISHAVSKMEKMIGSLSDPPDRLSLQFRDADLNDLVNDAVDEFSADGFADLKIEKQFGRLPRIKADVEEIYKVVHNLLLNAYEASDRSSDSPVHVSTEANDDQVVFRVSDNGIGMQQEFIENSLFQQFKSTKKQGLGIGLYQCKTIVEAHGGLIKVESEPGKGSTFSVYLPIL